MDSVAPITTLKSKAILVTGGTGSFGNFIVRRLLDMGVREVRVLSRDEKKQYDMRVLYGGRSDLTFVTGDVRDPSTVDEAMHGIEVVFNAAALKQVPNCELFPSEAIKTNVLGAENLVKAALRHKVETFVSVSTDKAVKPVNVLGMTKALQERLVLHANTSRLNTAGTRFCCVRYGNVLQSRGSVIPFFRRQISLGKRLTITDEKMTRFLLTLNDAINLVIFAADNTKGGEIFVRKAPSARVVDLARVLLEEAGKPLEYDVIGIFPGEKFDEILVSEEEFARTEELEGHYVVHPSWSKYRPAQRMNREYSSGDLLVDPAEVKQLITRADKEFVELKLNEGEFSKF